MNNNHHSLWKDREIQIAIFLLFFFTIWRVILFLLPPVEDFSPWSFAWGATYQIVALFGALFGFGVANRWGGWKSAFGKSINFFAVGLLFQSFGQAVSSYYVYRIGEVPYPGIGDIGFFGSIIFYILGVAYLARVTGAKAFFKSTTNKLITIVVPAALVAVSYYIFLNGYEYDWSNSLQTFLDFSYPIFQAIYVGVALLTFIVAGSYLGGMMKGPVLVLLFALVMQYISDFVFLYQISREMYIPEGINDMMYFFSYFLMTFAIIYTGNAFKKIKNS
jgi:hypothetical protein